VPEETKTTIVSTKASEMLKPKLGMGISGARRAAQAKLAEIKPEECPHRLGLEFDDSGSMSGQPLRDAITAVQNFLTSCSPLETSVAVYPMNKEPKALTNDYNLINLFVGSFRDAELGGTPLYATLINMLKDGQITRGIIFSDGEPTDGRKRYSAWDDEEETMKVDPETPKDKAIKSAKEKKIPVDTVFIGYKDSNGYKEMQWIAEQTGGIFVHFTDSASLSKSLKYLSPGLRGLLTNPDIKAKIERGEQI